MTMHPHAIVQAPLRAVPRIEVPADHHDLVGPFASGESRDDVAEGASGP